jgi:tetratricopeptide (TPR) repeat protein
LGLNYVIQRAGYYFLLGDFDRAAQLFTRSMDREPRKVDHYLARAICYLWMSQKELAVQDVETALTIAPTHELALLFRGDIHALEKNYDAALDCIERAHRHNPNSYLSYVGRGSVLRYKQEFPQALREFDRAFLLHSPTPVFFIIRSMTHFRLGNLEAARKDQDTALRLSEKDALTRPDFALQVYENYLDWAQDYYARILLKQPRLWYAYQGRADAYRVNHEHDNAIADYTRALEINPREPRLYLGRGKSYRAQGNTDRAAADYRQIPTVTDKLYLRQQAEELLKTLDEEK